MHITRHRLGSFGYPFDWPSNLRRCPKHKKFLRVNLTLHTEGAANILRYHTDVEFWNVKDRGSHFS
jgi:hypothetical protein